MFASVSMNIAFMVILVTLVGYEVLSSWEVRQKHLAAVEAIKDQESKNEWVTYMAAEGQPIRHEADLTDGGKLTDLITNKYELSQSEIALINRMYDCLAQSESTLPSGLNCNSLQELTGCEITTQECFRLQNVSLTLYGIDETDTPGALKDNLEGTLIADDVDRLKGQRLSETLYWRDKLENSESDTVNLIEEAFYAAQSEGQTERARALIEKLRYIREDRAKALEVALGDK